MKLLSPIVAAASVALVLGWPAVCQAQDASAAPGTAAPSVVAKAGDAIGRGAKAAAQGIERGAKAAEHGIKVGFQAAAHGIEVGAQATARVASRIAKKIESSTSSAPAAGT